MNTPWWLWKNVLICWVISAGFFPVSSGWCSVSMWGNSHGLQAAKPISFSTAYEGSQNCKLCLS